MTKTFAVIGNPIAHSLSPQMHNAWIADHGFDARYDRMLFEGAPAEFTPWVRTLALSGANVTVPFKQAAMNAADIGRRSGEGANVLTWDIDGRIRAANTDGPGFTASLDEAAPDWVNAQRVLILGAGGAANAIAHALGDREITVANRSALRAEELTRSVKHGRIALWNDLPNAFANADLIVQTTTLGMAGGPESPAWPIQFCAPHAIVVDIVYRPLVTPLLKVARARGLKGVDGLGMLIHQGALAFEMWFGVKPDTKKARARLLNILGEVE